MLSDTIQYKCKLIYHVFLRLSYIEDFYFHLINKISNIYNHSLADVGKYKHWLAYIRLYSDAQCAVLKTIQNCGHCFSLATTSRAPRVKLPRVNTL